MGKFKDLAAIAKELKTTEDNVRNLLALNSIALEDVDDVLLEALRQELKGGAIAPSASPIAPSKPIAKKGSELAIAPQVPQTAPKSKASEKFQQTQDRKSSNVAELMTNSDNGLSEVMELAQKELDDRRKQKLQEKAKKVADLLEGDEEAEFEEFLGFLSKNVRGQNAALRAQMQSAIDSVQVLDAEVV